MNMIINPNNPNQSHQSNEAYRKKVGHFFRAKTGELTQLFEIKYDAKKDCEIVVFKLFHPETKNYTNRAMVCKLDRVYDFMLTTGTDAVAENFEQWEAHKATGLVKPVVQIYKMNQCEWCAAESLIEAVKALADMNCDGKIELVDEFLDAPHVVDDSELDSKDFRPDLSQPANDTDNVETSFRLELKRLIDEGAQFPCYFACSEY